MSGLTETTCFSLPVHSAAMSMLNFYINRAGKNLPVTQKETLEKAKDELRDVFWT